MADNHIFYVPCHHILRHGDRNFPYSDFENMRFVKDRIKVIAKTKMDNIEAKIKEAVSAKRKSLDAEKRKRADMSVRIADV